MWLENRVLDAEIAKPSSGLEPLTPSLPCAQLTAPAGNDCGLFEPFPGLDHLPPVAGVCARSAP